MVEDSLYSQNSLTGSFDHNYLTGCYKTISFDRDLFATGQVVLSEITN